MSGTINLALSQQFDMDGVPLGGGLLYFFQAGTSTPQNAFQDTALTIVHPNPLVLDASGRVPMFYVASTEPPNVGQPPNGQIKIRLTDKSGVVVIAADNLLVIGPAGGGGGGGTVDATTVLATGDIKARYGIGTLTGFVRCNGNTIGNGTSGATERANADCQPLFEYLWSTGVLGVFSGSTPNRGSSATADFTANKNILLPDLRGRTLAGMDDMGASAANRLTSVYFGSSGTVLGNAGGDEKITPTQLPAHAHALLGQLGAAGNLIISSEVNSSGVAQNHTHTQQGTFTSGAMNSNAVHHHTNTSTGAAFLAAQSASPFMQGGSGPGATDAIANTADTNIDHSHQVTISGATQNQSANHFHQISGTTQSVGTGTAGPVVSPTMVRTFYIKL